MRFGLLENQYAASLTRLEFINEGSFLFSQLSPIACPFCGQQVQAHPKDSTCNPKEKRDLTAACAAEIGNIQFLQKDLGSTKLALADEKTKLEKQTANLDKEFKLSEDVLKKKLQPKMNQTKAELDALLKKRRYQRKGFYPAANFGSHGGD